MKQNTSSKQRIILNFDELSNTEFALVGQTVVDLKKAVDAKYKGYQIPNGFIITNLLWKEMLATKGLRSYIKKTLRGVDVSKTRELKRVCADIKKRITATSISKELQDLITEAVVRHVGNNKMSLVVRSSAIGYGQLPKRGLHHSVLNVTSEKAILQAVKVCLRSLFSEEAVLYREVHGIDHLEVGMAVLIQDMTHFDVSGVMRTTSTHGTVMSVEAQYGYYQAKSVSIESDHYTVFKPALGTTSTPIINKQLGSKKRIIQKAKRNGLSTVSTTQYKQKKFVLSPKQIASIARMGNVLEETYGVPLLVKWGYDIKKDFITVVHIKRLKPNGSASQELESYVLKSHGECIVEGVAVGNRISTGKIRNIDTTEKRFTSKSGDILVAKTFGIQHRALLEKAGGIILEDPSSSQYAAALARERGIPCVLGVQNIDVLKNGQSVTLDCSKGTEGKVYKGFLPFEMKKISVKDVPQTRTKIALHVSNTHNAHLLKQLPVDGVGLVEQAIIVRNTLGIHPLALAHYTKLKQKTIKRKIAQLSHGYTSKTEYAIDTLAGGIAEIAAAFYPHQVVLKLSDDVVYGGLLGASIYEKQLSESPRDATQLYSKIYKPAFKLECQAVKRAREEWGLTNIALMLPYSRTPEDAAQVLKTMSTYGLKQGVSDLRVYAACDIPSNLILAEEYIRLFDGLTIGSYVPNEEERIDNPVIQQMIKEVVSIAHKHKRTVSVSRNVLQNEDDTLMQALVGFGVDSITTNPDTVISVRNQVSYIEKTVGRTGHKTSGKLLSVVVGCAMLAAGLMSVGAGCSNIVEPVNSVDVESYEVTPAAMREQITEHIQKQKDEEQQAERSRLRVKSFAAFELDYPSNWDVTHWADGVTVRSADDPVQYVSVFRQIIDHPATYKTIRVGDLSARKAEQSVEASDIPFTIVEIDVKGDDAYTLEINGHTDLIDEILESFAFLDGVETYRNPLLNHWDVRDQRICSEMAVFARPDKSGGSCSLFTNPCDMPKGWHVCSGDS